MMFRKILIANRGEVAVRIIAAAQALDIATVAVFSEADAGALHVRRATESICVGPAPARQSYLAIGALVGAALEHGADAVHPGYGFLSESAEFAQAVTDAGLEFIGPPASVIALMGDKVRARQAAIAAGVPVLPGSEAAVEGLQAAQVECERLGYPVLVKASNGGGGRGLRIVEHPASLESAIDTARREAAAAFGNGDIFLERYLPCARHVEVQVLGDRYGNRIHMGDRDCTVQRRHQKMLEEAPAPDLPDALRAAMHAAALQLAASVDYVGAGTIEFLVDTDGEGFFFLEMNTRLQVEHGVTELVTGIDIVEQQIRIAAGERLQVSQDAVTVRGHAVQARILAEDPWDSFRPAPGTIGRLDLPDGPWIRRDFGVATGDRVEPHYDSMIGKLLAGAPDRATAIARLDQALGHLHVSGICTNAPYLRELLGKDDFIGARHHTRSVERDWRPDPASRPTPNDNPVPAHPPPASRERLVTLPGSPDRTIAIFGRVTTSRDGAVRTARATQRDDTRSARSSSAPEGAVLSPMDGVLVQLRVADGEIVREGQTLAVLEAMKMEVALTAPVGGRTHRLQIAAGAPVRKGQELMAIERLGRTGEETLASNAMDG